MANYKTDHDVHAAIADYIREQKQTTDPIKLKDFLTELKSIPNHRSYVVNDTSYKGTSISNVKYIDKIYLNTDIYAKELLDTLKELNFTTFETVTFNSNTFNNIGLYVSFASDVFNLYIINDNESISIYKETSDDFILLNNNGEWIYENITPVLIVNSAAKEKISINDTEITVGNQNNKISSVLSSTIFTRKTINDYSGEEIPVTGHIYRIYFNKDLDITNIRNTVNKLIFTPINNDQNLAYLVATDATNSLVILKNNTPEYIDEFAILLYQDSSLPVIPLFASHQNVATVIGLEKAGWNPNINDYYELNISCATYSEILSSTIKLGNQNNIISNILSVAEIQSIDTGYNLIGKYTNHEIYINDKSHIDLREYINNKELPLDIYVDTDTYISDKGAVIPRTYIDTIKFNKLSISETDKILSTLPYIDNMYIVVANIGFIKGIVVLGNPAQNIYAIFSDSGLCYSNDIEMSSEFGASGTGWLVDEYVFNDMCIETYHDSEANTNVPVGQANDSLIEIINSGNGRINLVGPYSGESMLIDNSNIPGNINIDIKKKITNDRHIPLNITVDYPKFTILDKGSINQATTKMYINKNLSTDEVNALLEQTTLVKDTDNCYFDWLIVNSDVSETLTLKKCLLLEKSRPDETYPWKYTLYYIDIAHGENIIYSSDKGFNENLPEYINVFFGDCSFNRFQNSSANLKLLEPIIYGEVSQQFYGEYKYKNFEVTTNTTLNLKSKFISENTIPDKIIVNIPTDGTGTSGDPIEINSSDLMDSLAVDDNIGKIYVYTGETNDKYTYGDIYIIEE